MSSSKSKSKSKSESDKAATASIAVGDVVIMWDSAYLGFPLAFYAAASWVGYFISSSVLRRIRDAPSARVSELRSLLSSSDRSSGGRLVVVRGQVEPKSATGALVSQVSGQKAVVLQRTQTCTYNEYDCKGKIVKTWNEQLSSSLKSVPFVLVEGGRRPHSESEYVQVSFYDSIYRIPLTPIYHHLHRLTTICHHVCPPAESPPNSATSSCPGHRHPVALYDEEEILPVGKEITAVGICRTRDGALEINSCWGLPCFLSDMTKDEIKADLTTLTNILFWGGILLGTLSVGVLGYDIIRNWQKRKDFRKKQQHQELHCEDPTQISVDEELVNVPDEELCVICLMRPRAYAFVPCGHQACCRPCALSLKSNCPVCWQSSSF